MTKPLSPAAQAMFDVLNEQFHELNSQHMAATVAALRAAAHWVDWESGDPKFLVLAITDELEAQ